jgi:putative alpha-1,2-mannosidase
MLFEGRYNAFTCVDFKAEGYTLGAPTEYGVWLSNFPVRGSTNLLQTYYGALPWVMLLHSSFDVFLNIGFVSEMGALFTFNPAPNGKATSILARVGVSFISSAQACANAEEEIPTFDFDGVHTANRAQWNDLLSRVQVDTTGVDAETTELFYSSVYNTLRVFD